jgi:hypothetical protein
MAKQIVAEGVWCTACEFFEVEDINPENGRCMACGCLTDIHVEVEVVTKQDVD